MSSSSLTLALALLAAAPLQAQTNACPARQGIQRLTAVDVFDGPPSEQADLTPDRSHHTKTQARSTWNVAYIYKAGRHVFLTCTYGTPKLTVEIPTKVDRCQYRSHRKRLSLTCK